MEDAARILIAQVAKESTFDPDSHVYDPQGVTLGLTQMRADTSYRDFVEYASAEGLVDADGQPWYPGDTSPEAAMLDPWRSIHMGAFILSMAGRSGGAYVGDAAAGEILDGRPRDVRVGYHVHSRGPTAWRTGEAPSYNQTEAWGDFYTDWSEEAIALLGGDPAQIVAPLMTLAELEAAGYTPFWEGEPLGDPGDVTPGEGFAQYTDDPVVCVFDFDDTIKLHHWGSPIAEHAVESIRSCAAQGAEIAIASASRYQSYLMRRLSEDVAPEIFDDAFFASPAFQTGDDDKEPMLRAILVQLFKDLVTPDISRLDFLRYFAYGLSALGAAGMVFNAIYFIRRGRAGEQR